MTILTELIEAASGDGMSVATLLRKVKVVAARMKTGELETWVERELTGYPPESELPSYRGPFPIEVYANYGALGGGVIRNGLVPPRAFPQLYRDIGLFEVEFRQAIVAIERLMEAREPVSTNWPADIVASANGLIARGELRLYEQMGTPMGIQAAWGVVPPDRLRIVVDTVRTRILDLALALEAVAADVGQPDGTVPNREQVHQIITTNIYGGTPNVAVGSSDFSQYVQLPAEGDKGALFAALAEIGLEDDDLEELRDALESDDAAGEAVYGEHSGSRVTAWLGRLMLGAGAAAGKGGAGGLGALAAKVIAAHFGLKS